MLCKKELKKIIKLMNQICEKNYGKHGARACKDCPINISPYCLKYIFENDDIKCLARSNYGTRRI